MKKLLLVADDSKSVIDAVHLILDEEFDIISASTKESILALYDVGNIDVIFLDIDFYGNPDGWEILQQLRKKDNEIAIFLMTGNPVHKRNGLVSLADGFLEKPFDTESIRVLLNEKGLI